MADSTLLLETFTAMLRIAQIESGTRRAGFTDLSLSELLESLVEIYGPVAEDSGHVLTSRIAPDVRVTGDAELLTQLFVNLVENSIKHTPRDARVEVILELRSARALAAVADNGPGIPEPMREYALRRFVRLEASSVLHHGCETSGCIVHAA
jgi:signal transduction histidine kinase